MKKNGVKISSDFGTEIIQKLSDELMADAFVMGELIDLGVNLELNLKMIDAKTGEIISAASEEIRRTKDVIYLYESK